MKLKIDDWKLTLREFESKQLQNTLQMEINQAAIEKCKKKIKEFPKDDKANVL